MANKSFERVKPEGRGKDHPSLNIGDSRYTIVNKELYQITKKKCIICGLCHDEFKCVAHLTRRGNNHIIKMAFHTPSNKIQSTVKSTKVFL